MELLVAHRLGRLREGAELLANVNLRLKAGDRVGLAGANGSGKSTLLRTLAGLEQPDSGTLWRAPGVRLGYLPQHHASFGGADTVWQAAKHALAEVAALEARMRELERAMTESAAVAERYERVRLEFERAGGFGARAALRRELAVFGFKEADDDRPLDTLSSGERRRLALAVTLAANPDALLLDEPTNHLDIDLRVDLTLRLSTWPGALVVVSHDRALLDGCTVKTAFLERARGEADGPSLWSLEPGSYALAATRRDAATRASHKRERERERESERLAKMAAELAAFGKKAAARKRGAERQLSKLRLAGALVHAHTPQPRPLLAQPPVDPSRRGHQGQELLRATALTAEPVLEGAGVTVRRGERTALLGKSGSGKSTLLALLAGVRRSADPRAEVRYLDGLRLRYLSQEGRGLDPDQALWDQALARVGSVAAGRLLAGAGVPPKAWGRRPDQLSSGERARAGLALALAETADVWLIDEPTNDLDLAAVEALEQQLLLKLEDGDTALLLATHDRRLAEALTTEVWSVEDGHVRAYRGVQEYLAGQRTDHSAGVSATSGSEPLVTDEFHETTARRAVGREAPTGDPVREPLSGGAPGAPSPAQVEGFEAFANVEELEARRNELLKVRDEEPALTDRDRHRLQTLLADVEGRLMTAYEARLPRPAPRYRSIELGLHLYSDRLSEPPASSRPATEPPTRLAVVAPHPAQPGSPFTTEAQAAAAALELLCGGSGPHRGQADVAATNPFDHCAPAWLEVRREGQIGHLRLVSVAHRTNELGGGSNAAAATSAHEPPAHAAPGPSVGLNHASAPRYVRAALANAGARLAFTRLGVQAVQLYEPAPLPGTILERAGDGWWALSLERFLALEGWRARPRAAGRRRRRSRRRSRARGG